MSMRLLLIAALIALATPAAAQFSDNKIKIGVLTDMSGPFTDTNGQGSVVAVQMAIEDYGGKVNGVPVEMVFADMQAKVDPAVIIGRRWIEAEQVDVLMDIPSSAAALALSEFVREQNKTFLVTGAGTARLTGDSCSPNTVHWTMDTYSFTKAVTQPIVARGDNTWFFITADYAFGYDLEGAATALITASGGKVLGSVRHPLGGSDFSSQLLAAQASQSKVIGLANGPTDIANTLKQAAEFGILKKGGVTFAALSMTYQDVLSIGLPTAQGLLLSAPFYWDTDDGAREFSARFAKRHLGRMPNIVQAGNYSATLHYLKALAAAGTDKGDVVVKQMKAMPTDDPVFGKGRVREDGRKIHPFYLLRVKSPAESKSAVDVMEVVTKIPGDEAFRPIAEGGCKFLAAK